MSSLYFAVAAIVTPTVMTFVVILPLVEKIGTAMQNLPL